MQRSSGVLRGGGVPPHTRPPSCTGLLHIPVRMLHATSSSTRFSGRRWYSHRHTRHTRHSPTATRQTRLSTAAPAATGRPSSPAPAGSVGVNASPTA